MDAPTVMPGATAVDFTECETACQRLDWQIAGRSSTVAFFRPIPREIPRSASIKKSKEA